MDTNLSVIELVQTRPILYSKCNDFPERATQWKEVADILKTDVSLVKSRWHLLRERFMAEYSSVLKGNRSTFKYFTDMTFLSDHINLDAYEMYSKENDQYRTEPEFNFTKQDVEEASDDEEHNEFIELELDEESHRELAQIPFNSSAEDSQNVYVEPIYIDEYSNASQSLEEDESITKTEQKPQQVEMFIEVSASTTELPKEESITSKALEISEDKKCTASKIETHNNVENKTIVEQTDQSIEKTCKSSETSCLAPSSEETPAANVDKPTSSPKAENYRCEDTIFGELVTATLRQMNTDKKKAVKREIMNLLFT